MGHVGISMYHRRRDRSARTSVPLLLHPRCQTERVDYPMTPAAELFENAVMGDRWSR